MLGLDLAYARPVHWPLALCRSRALSLKHTNPPASLPVSLSHRSLPLSLSLFLSLSLSFPLSLSFSLSSAFFPPLSPCVKVPLSCARSLARLTARSYSRFRLRLRSRPCLGSRACFLCACLFSALSLSSLSRMLSLCVSIFSTLFVFSLARAFSLCLVRSLLSFLAVSGPHLFGSVAQTSEMVSVHAHDGRAQEQANSREISSWLSIV